MTSLERVDLGPYLVIAHAIVSHGARPTAIPPEAPGDRVFVTVWEPGKEPRRATGVGPTLIDSVVSASEALAATPSGDGARVEIDALTAAVPTVLEPSMRVRGSDVGVQGYAASDGAGRVGWILPSEVLQSHYFGQGEAEDEETSLDGTAILATIAGRGGPPPSSVAGTRTVRIAVDARIEPPITGETPTVLFRTMPPHPTDLTPDALLAAVRASADYLARAIDDRGAFTYLYDPLADKTVPRYDMLRHAGAIYALMEAYDELRVPAWREKAARAVGYLKDRLTLSSDGAYLVRTPGQEQREVGGNGLALIALVQYAQATGDVSDLSVMRQIARLIAHQQYEDGHFRENADVAREDPDTRDENLSTEIYYYAGEATLGLVRLYAIDPNPQWLAGAEKAANYLVQVRDAHDDLQHQIHDHWLSYALHDLYVRTRDPSYAAHANKIAAAILLAERAPETVPYPDYVGTFRGEGETTPTSVRLEALASTYQLARFMGVDENSLRRTCVRLASFTRGQQLDTNSSYFAKNPSRTLGGVRESLLSSNLRIDYAQHAMSGWLRLARLLRDSQWGTSAS